MAITDKLCFIAGNPDSIEAFVQQRPATPDVVISNAALGSATVAQYEPDAHKQDLAMLQVSSEPLLGVFASACAFGVWLGQQTLPLSASSFVTLMLIAHACARC